MTSDPIRVAIVARNPEAQPHIAALFLADGFVVADHCDVVVVVGGDGTLLRAERLYPGIPKALLRDSAVGNLYMDHKVEDLIRALKDKRYAIEEKVCLEATALGKTYRAANDIIIRNKRLTQAIRFTVMLGGKSAHGDLIGDGVVVATPLGSTAYYHTITKKTFEKGVGIAFNNIHNKAHLEPIHTSDIDITITVQRGPADLGVDNSEHVEELGEGDSVHIGKSLVPLRLIRLR